MTYFSPQPGSSILGTRVARIEDPRLVTGQATFTAGLTDPRLDGSAVAVFLRSPIAHARIGSIDTAVASAAPGVLAVLTAADLGLPPATAQYGTVMVEPYLAEGLVRYVGQAVALVVADTEAAAVDACELVEIDYQPLAALVDVEAAARDEMLLFPEAGTNIAAANETAADPGFFAGCDVVVSQRIVNNRVAPAPLEGRAAAAVWTTDTAESSGSSLDDGSLDDGSLDDGSQPGDGSQRGEDSRHLTMWLPNQGAQHAKKNIVDAFGIDAHLVHVITPDVGGAFGAKFGAEPDHIAVAAAARVLGRAVRWSESRTENLTGMTHGRAQVQIAAIGGSRDGRMIAYRLDITQDAGAYPRLGIETPHGTAYMAPGVYSFARIEVSTRSVLTTTTPVGAFRGAGRPEATAAVERATDLFAATVGLDPADVRKLNLLPRFDSPHTSLTGAVYDSGDFRSALDTVLAAADYSGLRNEQAERRQRRDDFQLGLGLSTYVEITGGGKENATVTIHSDGTATVFTGVSPHGQGHATAFAMIVSDQLGIPVEQVELVWGDTDLVPRGGGTGGSRSLQLGGSAAHGAARAVAELAKERAGQLWEIDPADLVVDRARSGVAVAGIPDRFVTFAELAAEEELSALHLYAAAGATFPFGAHLAVVEVDIATGKVQLRSLYAVDDAGTILNPLLAEGQRHGGLAQGVAQALFEEASFDNDGNPLTATFADYGIPTAADLPSFTLLDHETPTPYNVLGAKGIGEAATIGATPAVQNAVIDAVSHLGVRHIDMPLTPQRVWRAIQDAAERLGH
ncbi:MAG: xanthine dehydrogenase family protein molybdopterin-binding subunit [Nakamurella sp.]